MVMLRLELERSLAFAVEAVSVLSLSLTSGLHVAIWIEPAGTPKMMLLTQPN